MYPSPATADSSPLSSQHSANFPALLRELDASLLVTTYQAGKVVLVRADGDVANTHFRTFVRPMGVAVSTSGALALGTNTEILEFRNAPAVGARLDPPGRHDAVFMPRRAYITGAIDIHEIAYGADDSLWYVNTLFSCLCTVDRESSFNPVWRPRFVTKLSAEDRCHLNGLAMRDGQPSMLTALGVSDDVQGWRDNKRDGGVLIDYASREVVASALCMPHSPRWHDGRLWLLESGRGALLEIDPASGAKFEVARLPGFLRGLDFAGPLAFVGVCQQRDSNAFTDIPITDDNGERLSGVWVVDVRNGRTVALLRFTGGVQEVFSVNLLFGITWPELINEAGDLLASVYSLPEAALAQAAPARPFERRRRESEAGGIAGSAVAMICIVITVWGRKIPKRKIVCWLAGPARQMQPSLMRSCSMARERLKELVLHARDGSGEVAGVCTVVPMTPPRLAQPMYYYRCFIGKPWRSSRLVARLLLQAFDLLEAYAREHGFPCIGMLLELENTRFGQTLRAPVWRSVGFTYAGLSGRGLELRLRYFRGARLKRPAAAQE